MQNSFRTPVVCSFLVLWQSSQCAVFEILTLVKQFFQKNRRSFSYLLWIFTTIKECQSHHPNVHQVLTFTSFGQVGDYKYHITCCMRSYIYILEHFPYFSQDRSLPSIVSKHHYLYCANIPFHDIKPGVSKLFGK